MTLNEWNNIANKKKSLFIDEKTTISLRNSLKGFSMRANYTKDGVMEILGTNFESLILKANSNFHEPIHKCCFDIVYEDPITKRRIGIQAKTDTESSYFKLREHNNACYIKTNSMKDFIEERQNLFNDDYEKSFIENSLDEAIILFLKRTKYGLVLQKASFNKISELHFSKVKKMKSSYRIFSENGICYCFGEVHTFISYSSINWEDILIIPTEKKEWDYEELGKEAFCKNITIPFVSLKDGKIGTIPNACYLNLKNDPKAGKYARSLRVSNYSQKEILEEMLKSDIYFVDIEMDFVGKKDGNLLKLEFCSSRNELNFKDKNNSKNSIGLYISSLLDIDGEETITLDILKKKNIWGIKLELDEKRECVYKISTIGKNELKEYY